MYFNESYLKNIHVASMKNSLKPFFEDVRKRIHL